MLFGCERALRTVNDVLGKLPSKAILAIEDVEGAFLHVRRCRSCKESLTSEDYGTFMNRVLLERE
jgi:hypothetical protein